MARVLPLPRIVVGVDGSAASAAAVRWAVQEARLRHATIHLVCAYHSNARLRASYASASWVTRQHHRRAEARAALDLATEAASRRLPPERLVSELVNQPPARALLDRAADAEMLVLGTTRPGRQPGQPPAEMGPVTRTCLRLARCPVVVISDEPPGGHSATRWGYALALSGGRASRALVPHAQGNSRAERFPGPLPAWPA